MKFECGLRGTNRFENLWSTVASQLFSIQPLDARTRLVWLQVISCYNDDVFLVNYLIENSDVNSAEDDISFRMTSTIEPALSIPGDMTMHLRDRI